MSKRIDDSDSEVWIVVDEYTDLSAASSIDTGGEGGNRLAGC